MNDLKSLDQLSPIANEMLGGLHATEAMRLRVLREAKAQRPAMKKKSAVRFAPALCCAALALACVGVGASRMQKDAPDAAIAAVSIDTIAAGEGAAFTPGERMADLGDNAMLRIASTGSDTLFAAGSGDIPLVSVGGAIYQMLSTPMDIGSSLVGSEVGSVLLFDEQPSLASPAEMNAGLSNVVQPDTKVYAISGMAHSTAVTAEVDGAMRVFQRVSYAGKGPAGATLEETFSVRGRVKSAELSGVGTLEGEKANEVLGVLLDHAVLKSADATARSQTLTVTLDNGLRLQLGVSGDTVCGCGGWSCPEFFEAFETAL